jgi:hypothetical protein
VTIATRPDAESVEDEEMVTRFPVAEEFVSLRDAMDRLLSESFVGGPFRAFWSPSGNGAGRMPLPLDVYATSEELYVIAAIPGFARKTLRSRSTRAR